MLWESSRGYSKLSRIMMSKFGIYINKTKLFSAGSESFYLPIELLGAPLKLNHLEKRKSKQSIHPNPTLFQAWKPQGVNTLAVLGAHSSVVEVRCGQSIQVTVSSQGSCMCHARGGEDISTSNSPPFSRTDLPPDSVELFAWKEKLKVFLLWLQLWKFFFSFLFCSFWENL